MRRILKQSIVIIMVVFLLANCEKDENRNNSENNNFETVTDIDGNTYNTIKIGEQIWIKENLRVTKTFEGTPVENFVPNGSNKNIEKYGRLYEWKVACEICPDGWHLPSKTEFQTLINYLGGEEIAGEKVRDSLYWDNSPFSGEPLIGTNESGFSALPAGMGQYYDGNTPRDFGHHTWFWANSIDNRMGGDTDFGYLMTTGSDNSSGKLKVFSEMVTYKFSVRCIKDY